MKDLQDELPRLIQNGETGRWHIQYLTLAGNVTLSSLSWVNKDSAQKIADHILTTNPSLQIL